MADDPQVFLLNCGVQSYEWGKLGQDSEVAALKAGADPQFKVDSSKKYAELWMGTHTNCPSVVVRPGHPDMPLKDWVEAHPQCLGSEVRTYFKDELPFLFKVLSVRTALSIQAHPNKVHAELLHKERPDVYKDPNHKPEMAVALTPFLGLCGFRPVQQIAEFCKDVVEMREAIGSKHAMKLMTSSLSCDGALQREGLQESFHGLMHNDDKTLHEQLKALVTRIQTKKQKGEKLSREEEVVLKLHEEFPGDPGAFCVFFLNLVMLQPGEAMFLEANLPHAYLSGDCMECMACSDNVVRAGLTPKYIDKDTLIKMLDYTGRPANCSKFTGQETKGDVTTTVFRPPVPDFGVTKFEVPDGVKEFKLDTIDSASICIVIRGQGQATNSTVKGALPLRRGSVFFAAAKQDVTISATGGGGMLVFQAYAGLV